MEVKKCPRCGEVKPTFDFYKKKSLKSGISSWCKACGRQSSSEYRRENKEKISEKSRILREVKADEISKRRKQRYYERKIIISEQQKEYYNKTRDKRCEYSREYRKLYPEKSRARIKKWEEMNSDKVRVIAANARARRRDAIGDGKLSHDLASRLLGLQNGRCAICGCNIKSGYHIDHIMPIALGGANVDENIQLLCQPCNNKKHAKHPIDYMQSLGRLL